MLEVFRSLRKELFRFQEEVKEVFTEEIKNRRI